MKKIKYTKNLKFLFKGILGYIAYITITPIWFSALLHKWRGVNMLNYKNTYIAPNVLIDSIYPEYITIEAEVYLTRGVKVLAHFNPTDPQKKIIKSSSLIKKTTIKEGAFIGVNSIINAGITVGKCALVAAGSVVVKDVPDFAIVGGNPAKILGDIRTKNWNKV